MKWPDELRAWFTQPIIEAFVGSLINQDKILFSQNDKLEILRDEIADLKRQFNMKLELEKKTQNRKPAPGFDDAQAKALDELGFTE